jgi:PadR family transcriptional regulator PadR
MDIQYKKGVLKLCLLSLLYNNDWYGYDISEALSKITEISDGTVYPILRKMKTEGLVNTYLSEKSNGPPRKYYTITTLGKEEFQKQAKEWLDFSEAVKNLIKENYDG